MTFRIVFRPKARADIDALTQFSIKHWGIVRTADYLDSIQAAMRRLSENPQIGSDRSSIAPGLRKLTVGSHAIYYFIGDDNVRISRLLHGSQDASKASDFA